MTTFYILCKCLIYSLLHNILQGSALSFWAVFVKSLSYAEVCNSKNNNIKEKQICIITIINYVVFARRVVPRCYAGLQT